MKTIHKAGIGGLALVVMSYVGFSSAIFLDQDSGSSNERWVAGAKDPVPSDPVSAPGSASQSGPELAAVYTSLTAHLQAGEFDKLIALATTAIEKNQKVATLYYFRGFASLQKKLFDDSIRDFSAALELAPTYADAYRFRAQAHLAKGEVDRAIADAGKVCELEPKNAESYVIRAMAYLTKGDVARARPDVAKVLELDPSNEKAKVLSKQLQSS
jgi:tetratricopeptide (TPR) repeat protein